MTLKDKLVAAKNNVTEFIKEDGKTFLIAAGIGIAGGLIFVVREHTKQLNDLYDTVNHNANVGNWERLNPWHLEKLEDGTFNANRVHLTPKKVSDTEPEG